MVASEFDLELGSLFRLVSRLDLCSRAVSYFCNKLAGFGDQLRMRRLKILEVVRDCLGQDRQVY